MKIYSIYEVSVGLIASFMNEADANKVCDELNKRYQEMYKDDEIESGMLDEFRKYENFVVCNGVVNESAEEYINSSNKLPSYYEN